jgi:hypothetical protein
VPPDVDERTLGERKVTAHGALRVRGYQTRRNDPIERQRASRSRAARRPLFGASRWPRTASCSSMAGMMPQRFEFRFSDLECDDEADGAGSAEPILSYVVFVIDGQTASLDANGDLVGTARVVRHNELWWADVDPGAVPLPYGEVTASDIVQPIRWNGSGPGPLPVEGLVGCVFVFAEEDNVGHPLFATTPVAGYPGIHSAGSSLVGAVQTILDALLPKLPIRDPSRCRTILEAALRELFVNAGDASTVMSRSWITVPGVGGTTILSCQGSLGAWKLGGRYDWLPTQMQDQSQPSGVAHPEMRIGSPRYVPSPPLASSPAAAGWSARNGGVRPRQPRSRVAALGADGRLWLATWDGSELGPAELLEGIQPSSAPAMARLADRRHLLACRGPDGRLYSALYSTPGTPLLWAPVGTEETLGAPSLVAQGMEALLLTRSMDGYVIGRHWENGVWGERMPLGGPVTSTPVGVSYATGCFALFAQLPGQKLGYKFFESSPWSRWETLDGTITSAPAALGVLSDRVDLVARNAEGTLMYRYWDPFARGNVAWSPWTTIPVACEMDPALAPSVSGLAVELDIFVRGTTGLLSVVQTTNRKALRLERDFREGARQRAARLAEAPWQLAGLSSTDAVGPGVPGPGKGPRASEGSGEVDWTTPPHELPTRWRGPEEPAGPGRPREMPSAPRSNLPIGGPVPMRPVFRGKPPER